MEVQVEMQRSKYHPSHASPPLVCYSQQPVLGAYIVSIGFNHMDRIRQPGLAHNLCKVL